MNEICLCGHEKTDHFKGEHWCEYCSCVGFIPEEEDRPCEANHTHPDCSDCGRYGFECDGHSPDE